MISILYLYLDKGTSQRCDEVAHSTPVKMFTSLNLDHFQNEISFFFFIILHGIRATYTKDCIHNLGGDESMDYIICDCIWENQPVSEKTKFFFIVFLPFYIEWKMPPSKFEANLTLRLHVRHAYFFLSVSCSNDYFRSYTIIDFLANWLVFLNTVTYVHVLLIVTTYLQPFLILLSIYDPLFVFSSAVLTMSSSRRRCLACPDFILAVCMSSSLFPGYSFVFTLLSSEEMDGVWFSHSLFPSLALLLFCATLSPSKNSCGTW